MHMEITPNRQSLPRRFISLNRVATQRAPSTEKNRLVKISGRPTIEALLFKINGASQKLEICHNIPADAMLPNCK